MPYQHIGRIDRQLISDVQRRNLPREWVARIIRKHPATVSRELARNADPDGHYNSHRAHAAAAKRRSTPRGRKLDKQPALRQYVLGKLQERWSPQAISMRLMLDHPDDQAMRISHQAIYDFIERDKRLGDDSPHDGKLSKQLRRQKRYRKKRTKAGRTHIPDRVGIEHRPPEVESRQQPGHLEADTVYGNKTNACLTTIVERKTRVTRIRRCPNRRARTVTRAAATALQTLPSLLVKTITFDNGSEFARHQQLSEQTGVACFFANPYHSWERGSNENTNGLIRDFFPKRTNFSRVSDAAVARVEDLLNNRPRKCLGWRTPNEALEAELALALGG